MAFPSFEDVKNSNQPKIYLKAFKDVLDYSKNYPDAMKRDSGSAASAIKMAQDIKEKNSELFERLLGMVNMTIGLKQMPPPPKAPLVYRMSESPRFDLCSGHGFRALGTSGADNYKGPPIALSDKVQPRDVKTEKVTAIELEFERPDQLPPIQSNYILTSFNGLPNLCEDVQKAILARPGIHLTPHHEDLVRDGYAMKTSSGGYAVKMFYKSTSEIVEAIDNPLPKFEKNVLQLRSPLRPHYKVLVPWEDGTSVIVANEISSPGYSSSIHRTKMTNMSSICRQKHDGDLFEIIPCGTKYELKYLGICYTATFSGIVFSGTFELIKKEDELFLIPLEVQEIKGDKGFNSAYGALNLNEDRHGHKLFLEKGQIADSVEVTLNRHEGGEKVQSLTMKLKFLENPFYQNLPQLLRSKEDIEGAIFYDPHPMAAKVHGSIDIDYKTYVNIKERLIEQNQKFVIDVDTEQWSTFKGEFIYEFAVHHNSENGIFLELKRLRMDKRKPNKIKNIMSVLNEAVMHDYNPEVRKNCPFCN